MKFHITRHAKERLKERVIPWPDFSLNLKPAGKKMRREIRLHCQKNGINGDFVYWTTTINGNTIVYICELVNPSEYRLITAFKLKKELDMLQHETVVELQKNGFDTKFGVTTDRLLQEIRRLNCGLTISEDSLHGWGVGFESFNNKERCMISGGNLLQLLVIAFNIIKTNQKHVNAAGGNVEVKQN